MDIDLDALEAFAKDAGSNVWSSGHKSIYSDNGKEVAFCPSQANARYIAAVNPAVVLELIATIRKRDKAMRRLARALRIKTRALAIAQRECKYAQERTAQKEEKQ